MTVAELIERIMAAYAGATSDAMKSFLPVFYARLRKHEGEALESAATEVLGSFRAKYDQKFPIPADFEKELPSSHLKLPDAGFSIRGALDQRRKNRQKFYAVWIAGQGAKIKGARPQPVYHACNLMARDLGRNLKPEEIEQCVLRALSAARVERFGPLPKTNVALEDQYAQIRADWAKPRREAA